MRKRGGTREPVELPRDRRDGDERTTLPGERSQRDAHAAGLTVCSAELPDRSCHDVHDAAEVPEEAVDDVVEGGNTQRGVPDDGITGQRRGERNAENAP